MENNNSKNINQALMGLNLDSVDQQIQPGQLTYALNAVIENFDGGEKISYQNEQRNTKCITFPTSYTVIGFKNLTSLNKTIYFLTNPYDKNSEIGFSVNGSCKYETIISDANNDMKFSFSIDHPIHKIIPKITNCSVQLFWTDGFNPRRYIDLEDLPWKEYYNPNNDFKPTKLIGQLDSNKLLVQPNFSIPEIKVKSVSIGGNLQMGSYQFAIQYSNINGEGYTSYYAITNGVSIYENKITSDFNLVTSKSINISISNLDTTGLYENFNLAVIKTINNITSVELVGTFPITVKDFKYNYTGVVKDSIRLTLTDIVEKYPYYTIADDIFEVDGILGFSNLTKKTRENYQEIWSNVRLLWETWTIPYNKFEAYNNGANTSNLRSYMRDEVYALEGCFLLDNGEQTDSCPIPGRLAFSGDRDTVNNLDSKAVEENKCVTPDSKEKWQVYNTATLIGFSPEYDASNNCYVGPHRYGEFAFWESTDRYPNNPTIFGSLANQPIRHHKFPDSLTTLIHDNNSSDLKNFEHRIFPIGIKIDTDSLYNAIKNSSLKQEEKNKIVGFKIIRGNRANNKSIIAKGLVNNVGDYSQDGDTYYFPNYPFNDLHADPYFTTTKLESHTGYRPDESLEAFNSTENKKRFTFHSPDTNFYKPFGIDSGQFKIETIEYGKSYGHFVKVKKNAEYKFLSRDAVYAAAGIGVASGFTLAAGTFGWPTYSPAPVIGTFQATKDLFEKLIPFTNFGYTFNSVGFYGKSYAVPNSGNKQRVIDFGQYVTDGRETIESGNTLNNYRRESSVYLHTIDALLYPHEYSGSIPEDNSRYNLASKNPTLYNLDVYLNDLYQASLTSNTISIIPDSEIQSAIDANSFTLSTTTTAVFTIPTMLTSGLPIIDDVYSINGGNYKVIGISYQPIDSTNTEATITTEVTNYLTGSYTAPPSTGTIILTFAADGTTSTSATSIIYGTVTTNPPTTTSVTLSSVRADIQTFAATNPTINDFIQLDNGSDYDKFLYNIIYLNYLIHISNIAPVSPEKVRVSDICSYYGSIKKYLPNQWGRINDYQVVDTGYYQRLYNNDNTIYTGFPTVFGGDIYINRFAIKIKAPLFSDTSFGENNQTDIEYDKIGNYGFPMFWLSTRAEKLDINIKDEVDKLVKVIDNSPGSGSGNGSVLGKIWTVIKGLVSGGFANVAPVMAIMIKIFKEIYRTVAIANINFDNYKEDGIMETGIMYLYAYGIPYFFVESEVNIDYRHSSNSDDKNYFPNIGTDIPDDWLQEYRVPIIHDNSYEYNQSYSKQNNDTNYFSHLRNDYDPNKLCYKYYPNRVIYSDRTSLEETKNKWLVYRPSAYFDFSKSHGKLISLDSIETKQILARFENKTQVYNALTIVDISQGPAAYLGNSQLFTAPPIDLFETDAGFAGSQHKFLLKTENGHIFVDAKRSQILLLDQSNRVEILSNKSVSKWLNHNLRFEIQDTFPDINIDNNFKDIGLHGVYDSYNQRLIITKLDYQPLSDKIFYSDGKFYYREDKCGLTEIDITDRTKFCDRSWTLSYSFLTKTWISFHSYQPNYYIPVANTMHFQSGIYTNNFSSLESTLWNHDLDFKEYTIFYDKEYPYTIEYPFAYKYEDEILQTVKEYTIARKYTSYTDFYEPTESIFYNKSILYNNEETSGLLNLVPSPKNSLSEKYNYPKYNIDSKDVLVSRSDNFYSYNTFWNVVKSNDTPFFTRTCSFVKSEKELINNNLDYTTKSNRKGKIRGKNLRIRHILDDKHDVKLISKFINAETTKSFK